jgi:hypothetical protein
MVVSCKYVSYVALIAHDGIESRMVPPRSASVHDEVKWRETNASRVDRPASIKGQRFMTTPVWNSFVRVLDAIALVDRDQGSEFRCLATCRTWARKSALNPKVDAVRDLREPDPLVELDWSVVSSGRSNLVPTQVRNQATCQAPRGDVRMRDRARLSVPGEGSPCRAVITVMPGSSMGR